MDGKRGQGHGTRELKAKTTDLSGQTYPVPEATELPAEDSDTMDAAAGMSQLYLQGWGVGDEIGDCFPVQQLLYCGLYKMNATIQ